MHGVSKIHAAGMSKTRRAATCHDVAGAASGSTPVRKFPWRFATMYSLRNTVRGTAAGKAATDTAEVAYRIRYRDDQYVSGA